MLFVLMVLFFLQFDKWTGVNAADSVMDVAVRMLLQHLIKHYIILYMYIQVSVWLNIILLISCYF